MSFGSVTSARLTEEMSGTPGERSSELGLLRPPVQSTQTPSVDGVPGEDDVSSLCVQPSGHQTPSMAFRDAKTISIKIAATLRTRRLYGSGCGRR